MIRDWVELNMTPGIGPRAAAKLLERFVFLHVHGERGDGAVELEPPVFILLRRSLEQDFRI